MKLPRNLSGADLVKLLRRYGYEEVRQKGSHIRIRRQADGSEHSVTIPNHMPLKAGTLNAVLSEVASSLEITKDELLQKLLA